MLMAIDPGRDKCGLVVMNKSGEIKYQNVINTNELQTIVLNNLKNFEVQIIILGNGTTSNSAEKVIKEKLMQINKSIPIKLVDERHTTEEARKLYWKKKPPCGWRRILPTSMQVPPEPVDDIVAEILAQRFLKNEE